MKKCIDILGGIILSVAVAAAHEAQAGSNEGIFGLKPEYVHVLINPIPVYGLAVAAIALVAAWIARSRIAEAIALMLVIICSIAAWPVFHFGENGYHALYPQLDSASQQWLDIHMHRAELFIYAFYATAVLAIGALIWPRKSRRMSTALSVMTLAASIASVGLGAWISRAGGQVRHAEFRNTGAPATNAAPEPGTGQHSP